MHRKLIMLLAALLLCSFGSAVQAATTLKLADQNAETAWGSVRATQPWIKKVEEASNGTLKIDLYANQSLAKGAQSWAAKIYLTCAACETSRNPAASFKKEAAGF